MDCCITQPHFILLAGLANRYPKCVLEISASNAVLRKEVCKSFCQSGTRSHLNENNKVKPDLSNAPQTNFFLARWIDIGVMSDDTENPLTLCSSRSLNFPASLKQ